jgi:hypothetical protein
MGMNLLPTADAAGAVTGIAVIAVLLLALGGVFALARRSGNRTKAEHTESGGTAIAEDDDLDEEDVDPNVGGMGLALAAAILAVVSIFLPALESSSFSHIEKNTLIQSGTGYLVAGCAVGIAGAVYRVYNERKTTWAVFILGAVILAAAIYAGTGSRTELHSVVSLGGRSLTVNGSPGVGLYAAGAAGVLALFAGWVLAGQGASSFEAEGQKTKVCPDCAETVLDAARVCKHCGHEFDTAPLT